MSREETERPKLSAKNWAVDYGDSLYRYALSSVGDPGLAEELVQETYLAGIEALDKFKGNSAVKSWLIGILKHKIADHFRRKSRLVPMDESELERTVAELDRNFDNKGSWLKPPAVWPVSPEDELERKQIGEILKDCIDGLPEKLRGLYCMRDVEGMSTKEICKQMDISQTNVWVMMHRARSALRSCLENKLMDGK
ncbi:MAG: sigma-70 family RNA polymerase sigma factor [Nitrospinota bacterium]